LKLAIKCSGIGIIAIVFFVSLHLPPPPSRPATSPPTPYAVKRDKLGMSLAEFEKAHPGACLRADKTKREVLCREDDNVTYAGAKAFEAVWFFDKQLYRINLQFLPGEGSDVLPALQEKYGKPSKREITERLISFEWRNEVSSIRYNPGRISDVIFALDELEATANQEESEEYKRNLEKAVKTDM